ncbi:MAG: DNA polymerase III subunit beta [Verrucomicrobia subdivision 3 bacterium]|nr:DNA polymerase III subunit beta [Limisphaerales bacterium]MCS1415859.1 DNA polymerase III subunit beta [Limisphaerales bacterium]
MKISIAKEQLLAGLQAVQNIVSSRTTLPILSNVLLHAVGKELVLTTTDLDITISCGVEAIVKKGGSVTLPVKKLFGIVRELTTPEIDLEVDEKGICSIRAGVSFFKIHGLSADEFPPLPKFAEKKEITLDQGTLRSILRKTSYAVSTEEARYVLNGIYFCLGDQRITGVATDGRRLALVDEESEVAEESKGEFIVPTKAINELNRLLGSEGKVELRYTDNQASFTLSGNGEASVFLMTKLIDGNYPNYRQVIPGENKERKRIALEREEFLRALRRAEIMASEKASSVKLQITKNNVLITANTPDVGEARESIAINYDGNEIAVAFNPQYVMDPLKVLEEDEVFLELSDELSPGVLKVNGPFLYVIMPMRMS